VETASILLLSGGVESTTLLVQLADAGEPVQALFIDYGQRGAAEERRAAESQCARLGVELVALDLARVGATFRRGQDRKAHVPLPHRNLVALSLGLSYAANLGAKRLYLAANRADTTEYPSSSHAFLAQFRLICGLLGDVELAPAIVGLLVASVLALPLDLRELAMLGDGGANLLGFATGLGTYALLGDAWVPVGAAIAVGLNVVADTVSFSRVIERVPPLRFLDALGRRA